MDTENIKTLIELLIKIADDYNYYTTADLGNGSTAMRATYTVQHLAYMHSYICDIVKKIDKTFIAQCNSSKEYNFEKWVEYLREYKN